MLTKDWDWFVESTPWLLGEGVRVVVDESLPAIESTFAELRGFPALRELLERARVTHARIGEQNVELLTWERPDGCKLAWLCLSRAAAPSTNLCGAHQDLLAHFGGVIERSPNEPSSWLLNCNDALTERESHNDGSFIDNYLWIMEDLGGSWPIDPTRYYSICREANGNTTLCNRDDGSVLLFAPDHSFSHIVPLEGCPPYSLYRIPAAPKLSDWVEAIAATWLDAIS